MYKVGVQFLPRGHETQTKSSEAKDNLLAKLHSDLIHVFLSREPFVATGSQQRETLISASAVPYCRFRTGGNFQEVVQVT